MDGLEIAHRRLHNQALSGPPLADPVAVVRRLGALQAQEYAIAKWSVGQRCAGAHDRDVQRLIDSGAIIRTHVLRPTWHFVAAEDIGWMLALTGSRVLATMASYLRQAGVGDPAFLARARQSMVEVLGGGNHLTRRELGDALAADGIDLAGVNIGFLTLHAELTGLIANGAMRGKQQTYALLSERVGRPRELSPDEALVELTRRYFTSHGPATVKDFSWWSSLTLTQIRRGLSLLDGELVAQTVDGLEYWFAPADPPVRDRSPTAHVLQSYDECGVGYTQSRGVLNLAGTDLHLPNNNTLAHVFTVDSQLAGWWRRIAEKDAIVAELVPVVRISAPKRKAIDASFQRYAEFAGIPVRVRWPAG